LSFVEALRALRWSRRGVGYATATEKACPA